jgi:Immunoglobulin domain
MKMKSKFASIPVALGRRAGLWSCLGLLVAASSLVGQLKAQTMIYDDFETYPSNGDLNAVWINNSAAVSGSLPGVTADGVILTNSRSFLPVITGTNSGATRWAHDRSYVSLPEVIPANTPGLFTVWLYRNSLSTTAGQTRWTTGPGLTSSGQSVAVGWFNNATAPVNGVADVFDGTKFQGRHVGLGTGSAIYFNLNAVGCPKRTLGWHKFDIERLPDGSTRYYVDNVLGRSITNASGDWGYVSAGFGTTSATPGVAGEEVDFDGLTVITNNPSVITQPTNQLVGVGTTATFTVVATNSPTSYQWFFNGKSTGVNVTNTDYVPIVGATSSSLVINNVQATNAGYYFVIVTNANGYIGSAAASLVITVPTFAAQPVSQPVLLGANVTFSTTANGATPLAYQWQFNGNNITGATTNKYTKTNVQLSDAGNYRVRVTNAFGTIFSTNAVLTVITNPYPSSMTPLWTLLPTAQGGPYTWLNADGTQRGLAYNSASNHVLVISRTGGSMIHVLDGDTGTELYTMDQGIGIIGGGTFDVNMIGAADDGAVYICNLTLDGTGFNIYRYADDSPSTGPTVAYSGAPGGGTSDRWGDNIAVRGAGIDTQIIIGSRGGTNACVFTTADGVNFTDTLIRTDAKAGDIGLGVSFGKGNTFWGKANDGPTLGLIHASFDLGAGTATTLKNYTNFPAQVANIAVNPAENLLAGIAIETPNDLRLYDITDLNNDPFLLDWAFFTPNVAGQATGEIAFGHNRVYALNSNNGILALNIAWPSVSLNPNGSNVTITWIGKYTLQSATSVTGPYTDVVGATSPYTTAASGAQKYFRLKF